MKHDPIYHRDYVAYMDKVLENGHARTIATTEPPPESAKLWYLPHHGVYHPLKPEKICVVLYCSAKYEDLSLNDCLLGTSKRSLL